MFFDKVFTDNKSVIELKEYQPISLQNSGVQDWNIDLSKIKEREVRPENEVKIICDKVINIISLFYIGKVNFYKGRKYLTN